MLAETHPNISQLTSPGVSTGKGQGLDDSHLWENVKKDNELAFSILYKKYTQRLYNYGMHTCHNHDMVMDGLQELFASLWSKRKDLSTVHSVSAYLYKSFRRLLIKKITWQKRFLRVIDLQRERSFEIIMPVEHAIEMDELEKERNNLLKHCLLNLTKRQREAVFLKFYNDLNYADIASIMDLQVDSVYNIISKAIENLRQQLRR